MAEDLRHRYASALDDLDYSHDQQERRYVFVDDALEAVMAVRDEELERLREAARIVTENRWYERLGKAEFANARTRERLDALIAAGFGATTDTLRELRAALDDTTPKETTEGE